MTTALDIITNALQHLGVLAADEAPSASDAQKGLDCLNTMLDTWSTESLMVYTRVPQVFSVVAGQAAYTIGTGGNFNTTRPIKIDAAANRDANGNDYSIEITNDPREYARIVSKTVRSSMTSVIYDDGGYPLKTLTLYPVPADTTYQLVLWTWVALQSIADISDTLDLPPGYKAATEYNLPEFLAASFGRDVPNAVIGLAVKTKAQIKRVNTIIPEMDFPCGLPQKRFWGYPEATGAI